MLCCAAQCPNASRRFALRRLALGWLPSAVLARGNTHTPDTQTRVPRPSIDARGRAREAGGPCRGELEGQIGVGVAVVRVRLSRDQAAHARGSRGHASLYCLRPLCMFAGRYSSL